MRKHIFRVFGILSLTLSVVWAVGEDNTLSEARPHTSWALLVGIDDYQDPRISDLNYTVNDVTRFSDALIETGAVPESHVYLMTNQSSRENLPTHTNVLFRLENLTDRVRREDTFIFYFAGHGMVRSKEQYLLSINSDPRSLTTLAISAISLKHVQQLLGQIRAHQVIIILDACRNDPEKGRGDADNVLTNELARGIRVKPRRQVSGLQSCTATFYACSVGERAYEWPEREAGVFSFHLAEGLRGKAADTQNRITLRGLAHYVDEHVTAWSRENLPPGKSQMPWLVSEGTADMILAMLPETAAMEEQLKESIRPGGIYRLDIASPEGFQVFLDDQPTGQETPTLLTLPAGQYTLRLEKSGYQPYQKVVTLVPEHPIETIRAAATPTAVVPPGEAGFGMLFVKAFAEDQPTVATVFVDGHKVGDAPHTNGAMPAGTHEVKVRKPLYHDYQETVTVAKDRKYTVNARLQPAFGSLKVSSAPSDAEVELFDVAGARRGSGSTPLQLAKLPSGSYRLRVSRDRYYPESRDVVIRDGQTTIESLPLRPRFGTLQVESTPAGASVLLAGAEKGKTPLILEVDSGRYVLELYKELYMDWSGEVDIRDDKITRVSQQLPANFGTLDVQVTPPGSQILVDGKRMGRTPATLKLSSGTHRVEVDRDDYVPQVRESVFIGRDQTETLAGSLERKMGTLRVLSTPPEAHITVDGKDCGLTPNLLRLPTGSYRLQLSKEGLRDHEEMVTILWNKTLERNVELPIGPQASWDAKPKMPRIGSFPESREQMALRSLFLPGLGQYYGKRYGSGTLFLLTGLGAVAGVAVAYLQYDEAVDAYSDSVAQYNNAASAAQISATERAMIEAHDDADRKFLLRQAAFATAGGVWALNVLHALIAGPSGSSSSLPTRVELPDWDIVPQLTPHIAAVMVRYRF